MDLRKQQEETLSRIRHEWSDRKKLRHMKRRALLRDIFTAVLAAAVIITIAFLVGGLS